MISIFSDEYWKISKQLPPGIILVTPLWIAYEYFAFLQNQGLGGELRTGLDYLCKKYLHLLHVPLEISLILPAFLIVFYITKKSSRETLSRVRVASFGFMFLESIIYASVLGLIFGYFVELVALNGKVFFDNEKVSALIVNLGAGLYEEFAFRLILMSMILFIFQTYGNKVSYPIAVIISSIAFALFHYLFFFKESFEINSFLFRFVAGVGFSVLFLWRGLGISVYTHSFYNIFLMFR